MKRIKKNKEETHGGNKSTGNLKKSLFKMKEERQVFSEQRGQDRQGGAGKGRR